MADANDMDLVREFAGQNTEAAFAELVQRHVNLVYSVALRFTGESADAQDITQAVFILLARKAGSLRPHTVLTGWLYETTRFTARRLLRTRARRKAHEQEASVESKLEHSGDENIWLQLAPHLETAMSRLGAADRTLLALRFYENRTSAEAAALLGIHEEAARKRTSRALEKLRKFFLLRGVSSTTAIIAGTISTHSVQAAPAALAKLVTSAAMAKGATASASTLTLIKGALKIMAWTKAKTALVTVVVLAIAAGATTVTVKEIRQHTRYPWQVPQVNLAMISKFPPQVVIVPTIFDQGSMCADYRRGGGVLGICQPLTNIIRMLNAGDEYRLVFSSNLPTGRYDFFAKGQPTDWGNHWQSAFQDQIKNKFGVVQHLQVRNADVLLLRYSNPNAGGLHPPDSLRRSMNMPRNLRMTSGTNSMLFFLSPIDSLKGVAQSMLDKPVVDQTGLKGTYDYKLTWDDPDNPDRDVFRENIKRALLDELGMELVPTNMPMEMLVVEKAN